MKVTQAIEVLKSNGYEINNGGDGYFYVEQIGKPGMGALVSGKSLQEAARDGVEALSEMGIA
jgi:hypothetical protein